MEERFSIIDAISDSTFYCDPYKDFRKEHKLEGIKFKSLDDELGLELKDVYLFAKDGCMLFLLRCVNVRGVGLSGTDTWTAAVLKTEEEISPLKYPKIFKEIDKWIKEKNKIFE